MGIEGIGPMKKLRTHPFIILSHYFIITTAMMMIRRAENAPNRGAGPQSASLDGSSSWFLLQNGHDDDPSGGTDRGPAPRLGVFSNHASVKKAITGLHLNTRFYGCTVSYFTTQKLTINACMSRNIQCFRNIRRCNFVVTKNMMIPGYRYSCSLHGNRDGKYENTPNRGPDAL